MSLISSTISASAASPLENMFLHGKRHGVNSAIGQPGSASPQGPATTESLFGTLLRSVEEVIGLPTAGAAPASNVPPQNLLHNVLQGAQGNGTPSLAAVGANINAKA